MNIPVKHVQQCNQVVIRKKMLYTIKLINVCNAILWNSKTHKMANLCILKYNMKMIVKRSKLKMNQQHGSQKIILMGNASKIQKKERLVILLNMSNTFVQMTIIQLFIIVILIAKKILLGLNKGLKEVVIMNIKSIFALSVLLERLYLYNFL